LAASPVKGQLRAAIASGIGDKLAPDSPLPSILGYLVGAGTQPQSIFRRKTFKPREFALLDR
jgi:hypothetical protein